MPAHMIPSRPKDFDPASKEGLVFNALEKLPEDYYVFHSVSETVVQEGTLYEREIDFVIANRERGILCLEAKAGVHIRYENRTWYYSSGQEMKHGGPYAQIASAKRALRDKIIVHSNPAVRALADKCKVLHGVVFIDLFEKDFLSFRGLPEDADARITMFADDFADPLPKITKMYSVILPSERINGIKEGLSEQEFRLLLDAVLCPHFNLIPSPKAKTLAAADQMNQLLREQYRLLDFLEEQDCAVINGAAGTGKTMIAVEKARRHSMNGEPVLFLCYNRLLCDELTRLYKQNPDQTYRDQFKNVDFLTISKFTKQVTGNHQDFDGLIDWLGECMSDDSKFKYRHIIVDEGQDFGLVDASVDKNLAQNNCSVIDSLMLVAQEIHGTFYLFYDKYQMIQGQSDADYALPDCIENCDCRLTLRVNCRNTKEIAKTSVTPLRDKKNKAIKLSTACAWEEPVNPVLRLVSSPDDVQGALNTVLDGYIEQGITDIVILTPETAERSLVAEHITQQGAADYYTYAYRRKTFKVTTCKRFKGLEADAVVFIDLNKSSFVGRNGMQFYVGASRAKFRLDMICVLPETDYAEVISTIAPNAPHTPNIKRLRNILGNAFSADIMVVDNEK